MVAVGVAMKPISEFCDRHKGETMLLVGNGENLKLTPPEWFGYPSIGMNTIHLYNGWAPTYYTTLDRRVYREFGAAIERRFANIPKFIPRPRLMMWKGKNFYYFRNLQGLAWPYNEAQLWQENLDIEPMIYGNIMHVAIKLAYWMGATTILIIGMEHRPHRANRHFWGVDGKMSSETNLDGHWQKGYKVLSDKLAERNVRLLNISENTYVPADIIPQDDWRTWRTVQIKEN